MSEFKFACPVCGQHITADSSASGGHLECPTCFQKIVIPQAPSSADSKFILSASQVSKPRPTSSTETAAIQKPPSSDRASLIATVSLLGVLVVAGGLAFCFRDRIFKSKPPPDSVAKSEQPVKKAVAAPPKINPVPTNITWSLELTDLAFPEGNVVGSIHGAGFACDRATLQGGNLTLRQGRSGPADLSVTIQFFAQQGEELGGKTIEISADKSPPLPKLNLRWRDEQGTEGKKSIAEGYALKAAFGDAANGRIPGKIFLCMPDENKSFVAGEFNAEIRKPNPPKQKKPKK